MYRVGDLLNLARELCRLFLDLLCLGQVVRRAALEDGLYFLPV